MKRLASGIGGDMLSLGAGAALPLAFAPHDFFFVALLSLSTLFFCWLGVSSKRAMWRGWLFGLGMFGVGVTWVHISIHEFGGVPLLLSFFLTGLFVAFLSLFPAALGYLLIRFFPGLSLRSLALKLLWLMPAGWTLTEWVRGWFLTGFPWLNLGYSQIVSPLGGYAPVLGVYGVSWLVALTAGTMLLLVVSTKDRWRGYYAAGAASVWIAGYLLSQVSWTHSQGESVKVSLIQGNIPQELKWLRELRQPTIDLYTERSRNHWESDLIIWPETALPNFYHREVEFLDALGVEARANGTDLLVGVLYTDPETQQYYNSMVSVGEREAFYHKQHLVPFTEYLPLKPLFGGIVDFMNVPMSDFSAGAADQQLIRVADHKVGISICFEDAFGEEIIRVIPEASFLVNVSNDAWFAGSSAPYQHLQMAQMRALETGRPLVRATNTGVSAVIQHDGRLQSVAPQYEVDVLTDTIQPMGGVTPYARLGNWPVVSGALFILLIGARAIVRARAPQLEPGQL